MLGRQTRQCSVDALYVVILRSNVYYYFSLRPTGLTVYNSLRGGPEAERGGGRNYTLLKPAPENADAIDGFTPVPTYSSRNYTAEQ